MPFQPSRLTSLLATGAVATALAGCGSEDRSGLIPSDDAQVLEDRLDAVKASVEDGRCAPLVQQLQGLRSAVVTLPSTVDERLRRRLDQGLENLARISPPACQEAASGALEAPTETEPEPQTTTTAIPTTTTTEPPPTTATEPPPTTTTPPTSTGEPPGTGGTPVPPDPGTPEAGSGEEGGQ